MRKFQGVGAGKKARGVELNCFFEILEKRNRRNINIQMALLELQTHLKA